MTATSWNCTADLLTADLRQADPTGCAVRSVTARGRQVMTFAWEGNQKMLRNFLPFRSSLKKTFSIF
ncbi:MAG: hypothetical protein IJD43_14585, partial [Thermoguttaceae bacterium]|nr:hypothetical protein [Thermoguttaceae bacterium]